MGQSASLGDDRDWRRGGVPWPSWLAPVLVALYVAPWVAEIMARAWHIQIYTIALAAFAVALTREVSSSARR
jgi:hypothetical protein